MGLRPMLPRRLSPRIPDHATLRRRGRLPIWASITWRVLMVLALIGMAIGGHWIERDGLRDNSDGSVTFLDVIYFTMISVTTTGYGDIVPVSDSARLFDALIVTPIRIFVVLIFLGTTYNFVLRRTWDRWRMALIQRNLHNHIIVAGYGTSGAQAVEELISRGTPPGQIVAIDCEAWVLERAEGLGCSILQGDATRDTTLQAARVDRAQAIIICTGSDDTSILVALTARHLAPTVTVSIAIANSDNELIARQAGATTVINPVSFAGVLLAGSSGGSHIADYIADLASNEGHVKLHERLARPEEYGRALSELTTGLGVRIYRNNMPYGFWDAETKSLTAGDVIIEIMPTEPTPAKVDAN